MVHFGKYHQLYHVSPFKFLYANEVFDTQCTFILVSSFSIYGLLYGSLLQFFLNLLDMFIRFAMHHIWLCCLQGFFRRSVKERDCLKYQCTRNGNCNITSKTRNVCKMCRYRQCLRAGMKPDSTSSHQFFSHCTLAAL
jgi:Zinc finger, C4 type (two domains)